MEGNTEDKKMDLEEAVERIEQVEKRMKMLEDGDRKTLEAVMPKVDALPRERNLEVTGDALPFPDGDPDVASPATADAPGATLLEATERGEVQTLLRLLAAGADPQQRDARGHTALHLAAAAGHAMAGAALVTYGAAVNATARGRSSPLHCAARHGHAQVATFLLAAGADKNAVDADGHTPLALAIRGGHEGLVALLLEKGAYLKSKTPYPTQFSSRLKELEHSDMDEDYMAFAAHAQQWGVMKLLLAKGQRVYPKTRALAWAALAGKVDLVSDLLRRGAAPCDDSALWGLRNATSAAVVWAFIDAKPLLVEGYVGKFGLLHAATDGRKEALVALLQAGVGVNQGDDEGNTALHFAAADGDVTCVQELLECGANVQSLDSNGDTPLHDASYNGNVECIKALLAAGAKATKKNNEGKTPIDVAQSDDIREMIKQKSGLETERSEQSGSE